MILTIRIRLKPTKEQEEMFFKHMGCSRYVYNWALETKDSLYKLGMKNDVNTLTSKLVNLKKQADSKFLNEVSARTLIKTVKDLDKNYDMFFKGLNKKPMFKSKKRDRISFPIRTEGRSLYFKDGKVKIEKIGKVDYSSKGKVLYKKYYDGRIAYDGKYWILSFGVDVSENQVKLNKWLKIGMDLGIKDLAVLSDGTVFKNINKIEKMKKLDKKLRRLQRQLARKYRMNNKTNEYIKTEYIKTKNIIKLEAKIVKLHRKIRNIRLNHNHHLTSYIVKQLPSKVIIEDLNVKGMMKNRHLSRAIGQQGFYQIKGMLEYKCKLYVDSTTNKKIELILADRLYPSSKRCSSCGGIKKDLKLRDRTYKCTCCGMVLDRDLNASYNLRDYVEKVI